MKIEIIAELNTSHFGKIENAIRDVELVASLGADAVKFQSWRPNSLFTQRYLELNPIEARMYRGFSLSKVDLSLLAEKAHSLGIRFSSTPYSVEEVEDLVDIGADFIKIASMDFVSDDILSAAAATGLPIVASTGMCSWSEIEDSLDFLRKENASDVTVLHCTSLYPTPLVDSSLGSLRRLRDISRDYSIGFSDHTSDVHAALVALSLGAQVFEKHISVDKSKPGFDNHMAQSPEGFAEYVRVLREASYSLNSIEMRPSAEEAAQALKMRRSAHALVDLEAGRQITINDFEFKRPGGGVSYRHFKDLIGGKTKEHISIGQILTPEKIEPRLSFD